MSYQGCQEAEPHQEVDHVRPLSEEFNVGVEHVRTVTSAVTRKTLYHIAIIWRGIHKASLKW